MLELQYFWISATHKVHLGRYTQRSGKRVSYPGEVKQTFFLNEFSHHFRTAEKKLVFMHTF